MTATLPNVLSAVVAHHSPYGWSAECRVSPDVKITAWPYTTQGRALDALALRLRQCGVRCTLDIRRGGHLVARRRV
jgi:hypothetical protein